MRKKLLALAVSMSMMLSCAAPAYAAPASMFVNNGSLTNYEQGTISNGGGFENTGFLNNIGLFENGGEMFGSGLIKWVRELISKEGATNETTAPTGTCGDNVTWNLNDTGVLTISGEGMMYDCGEAQHSGARAYREQMLEVKREQTLEVKRDIEVSELTVVSETTVMDGAPWSRFADQITSVVVENGVRYVGAYAFANLPALTEVTLPETVNGIGEYAFIGDSALTSISLHGDIDYLGYCAFNSEATLAFCDGDATVASYTVLRGTITSSIRDGVEYVGVNGENTKTYAAGLLHIDTSSQPFADLYINTETGEVDSYVMYGGNIYAATGDNACGENATWVLNSDGSLYINGTGELYDYPYIAGSSEESNRVTSITVSDGITGIGAYAFSGFENLESVFLGADVERIGEGAFSSCAKLTAINLPSTLTSIGDYAFSDCSTLTAVTLPDGLESIGARAFAGSGLTGISVPSGAEIGAYAFSNCTGLTSAVVPQTAEGIFSGCESLSKITFNNEVPTIKSNAFAGCASLTGFEIPAGTTEIGSGAFSGCSALESISVPASVASIGADAFANCQSLASITYAGTLAQWRAISGSPVLPSNVSINVTAIGSGKLTDTTEWSLDNSGTLTITGSGAIPDNTTDSPLPWNDFRERIVTVALNENITSIGSGAFDGCSNMTSITGLSGLTAIGTSAFSDCSKLTSLTLPQSLETVGENAFSGCAALESITFGGTLAEWDTLSAESGLSSTTVVNVTKIMTGKLTQGIAFELDNDGKLTLTGSGEVPNFEGAGHLPWANYRDRILTVEFDADITNIGKNMFADTESMTSFTGTGVTKIGEQAFLHCVALTDMTFAEGLTSIGRCAFAYCTSLTDLDLSTYASLKTISEQAFDGCSALTSVKLPESVSTLGFWAFNNCAKLQAVTYTGTRAAWDNLTADEMTGVSPATAITCRAIAEGSCGETAAFAIANDGSMTINGTGVVTSSDGWADYAEEVTSLTVAEGITDISGLSLVGMTKLAQLSLPSSLEVMNEANTLCNADNSLETLMSITVGSLNKKFRVYNGALYDTGLTKLYYVVNVPKRAPDDGSTISGLRVPNTVREVAPNAFKWATNVLTVDFTGSKAQWDAIAGLSASGLSTATEVTYATRDFGFFGENDSMGWILSMEGVLAIGGNRDIPDFYLNINTEYEDELPVDNSDRQTAPWLAYADDIIGVKVNEGITGIGDAAFSGCSNLSAVSLPSSLRAIGIAAFYQNTSLRTVTVPAATEEIGAYAFAECANLKSVTINGAAVDLGKYMFRNCGQLTEVAFADNATVETIPAGFLYGCAGLETFTVPDGTNAIARSALANNKKLQTVTIPTSIESIDKTAFSGSTVNTIYFGGTSAAWQSLDEAAGTIAGLANTNIVCQGDETTTVVASGFCGNDSELGESVAWSLDSNGTLSIGADESASTICEMTDFPTLNDVPWSTHMANINTVIVANDIKNVGNNAFTGASNLKTVTLGENVETIGRNAFMRCTALSSINFPDSVRSIKEGAFASCTSLKEIELNNGLTDIGSDSFMASGVTHITIPGSVHEVKNQTFRNSALEYVIIENGVQKVNSNAFFDCPNLVAIYVPASITFVGAEAFANGTTKIYYEGTENAWGEKVSSGDYKVDNGVEVLYNALKESFMSFIRSLTQGNSNG